MKEFANKREDEYLIKRGSLKKPQIDGLVQA